MLFNSHQKVTSVVCKIPPILAKFEGKWVLTWCLWKLSFWIHGISHSGILVKTFALQVKYSQFASGTHNKLSKTRSQVSVTQRWGYQRTKTVMVKTLISKLHNRTSGQRLMKVRVTLIIHNVYDLKKKCARIFNI